ncbi:hypothetical protein NDU88_007362 [Pleurodeles waltl]|uniref:Uncharacterized protein n=1 Tax=Pleurodeles waltl TaxID=8319 RepID=A0AAV7NTE2_PLEWA|nr:hypothetical protein NDU88_007362 [Pleurodeles waltl]
MVRTKDRHTQQTNKMDNYAKVRRPDDPGGAGEMRDQGSERVPSRELLLSKIMAAIHDLKGFLLTGEDTLLGTPRCTGNKRDGDMGFLLTGKDTLLGTPRCTGNKRDGDMGPYLVETRPSWDVAEFSLFCFPLGRNPVLGARFQGLSGIRSSFCFLRAFSRRSRVSVGVFSCFSSARA